MVIDLNEDTHAYLLKTGWRRRTINEKRYLVSPEGIKARLIEDQPAPEDLKLYVLHAAGTSRLKFGVTRRSVEARMAEMQTGSASDLNLVGTIKIDDQSVEHRLHTLLSVWRTRGEWFDFGESVQTVIDAIRGCSDAATMEAALKETI